MTRRIRDVIEELERLRNEEGKIVPSECVLWARRRPKSALHEYLEWDDSLAAERYRVWQVREILQIHVADVLPLQRQFISLSVDRNGGGYRTTADVLASKDLRQIMLADAVNDLMRMRQRYQVLTELSDVWSAIEMQSQSMSKRKAA